MSTVEIVDPLTSTIIREILYASAYVQVQTLNYIGLFILSGRLLQISRCDLAPNSNVSFSPTSDCAKSFFSPLFLLIQSDTIVGGGDLPPARSCTVTGVDDFSLSSSVISVGRTRWHLAVKNISSADMPQARALFVRSPRQSGL